MGFREESINAKQAVKEQRQKCPKEKSTLVRLKLQTFVGVAGTSLGVAAELKLNSASCKVTHRLHYTLLMQHRKGGNTHTLVPCYRLADPD